MTKVTRKDMRDLAEYIESTPSYIKDMWGDQWVVRNDDDNTLWP